MRPPVDSGPQFDPEIASIFTEEATELLEAAETALAAWRADPANAELRAALKRPLHTLKGGARMAGIQLMGDLAHELETLVMQIDQGIVPTTFATFEVLQASFDELARMRESVAMGRGLDAPREATQRIRTLAHLGEEPVAQSAAPPAAEHVPAAQPAAVIEPAGAPAPSALEVTMPGVVPAEVAAVIVSIESELEAPDEREVTVPEFGSFEIAALQMPAFEMAPEAALPEAAPAESGRPGCGAD